MKKGHYHHLQGRVQQVIIFCKALEQRQAGQDRASNGKAIEVR
jgi:hypothetical protein